MSGDTGLYSERFCESVNGIAPLRWGTGSAKISLLHGEEPQLPSPHRRPDGLLSLSVSLSLNARFARATRAPYIFPSALLLFLWLQPYCESCSPNLVFGADRCGNSWIDSSAQWIYCGFSYFIFCLFYLFLVLRLRNWDVVSNVIF